MPTDEEYEAAKERFRSGANVEGIAPSASPQMAGRLGSPPASDSSWWDSNLGRALSSAGRAWSFVDKPISERLGVKIGPMAGPLDEIGNFLLEEGSRPTNLLALVPGLGVASKVAKVAPRLGKAAGIIEGAGKFAFSPISQSANPLIRYGTEIGMGALARGGAEIANEFVGEDASTPAKVGAGLAGGLAGILLGRRVASSVAEKTFGRDVLGLANPVMGVRGAPGYRVPDVKFSQITDDAGLAQWETAKALAPRQMNLSPKTIDELRAYNVNLSADNKTGYFISPEGDFGNLFNSGGQKGAGETAIIHAIQKGALTLDAYEGPLTQKYAKLGFEPVAMNPFNDLYAPPDWDYAIMGRPPIIHMAYTGGNRESILSRAGTFPNYRRPSTVTDDFDAAKQLSLDRALATNPVGVGGAAATGMGAGVGSGPTGVRGLPVTLLGEFLQVPSPDSLSNKTIKELTSTGNWGAGLEGVLARVKRSLPGVINKLDYEAAGAFKRMGWNEDYFTLGRELKTDANGKTVESILPDVLVKSKKNFGNAYIKDVNGKFVPLADAIEFKSKYALSPEQVKAIDDYNLLTGRIYNERSVFDIESKMADLEPNQAFGPRLPLSSRKGKEYNADSFSDTRAAPGLTGGPQQNERTYKTAIDGINAGVIYADPAATFNQYAKSNFDNIAQTYAASLKALSGDTANLRFTEAGGPKFLKQLASAREAANKLIASATGKRQTAAKQEVSANLLDEAYARAEENVQKAGQRVLSASQKLDVEKGFFKESSPETLGTLRTQLRSNINDRVDLAQKIGENLQLVKDVGQDFKGDTRELKKIISEWQTQFNSFNRLDASVGKAQEKLATLVEGQAGYKQAKDTLNARLAKLATAEEKYLETGTSLQKAADLNEALSTTLDAYRLDGTLMKDASIFARQNVVDNLKEQRAVDKGNTLIKGLEQDVKSKTAELGRLDRELARTGNQSAAWFQKYEATKASIADLEGQVVTARANVNQFKDKIASIRERTRDAAAGRVGISQEVAPLLRGRDFLPEDADVITKFFTTGLPATTQLGSARSTLQNINTQLGAVRAMGDMSSVFNQIGGQFFSAPATFVKNLGKSVADLIDPAAYREYAAQPSTENAVRRGIAFMGPGAKTSDYELGSWVERWPGLRGLNEHFRVFSTRNRVDMFNSLTDAATKAGKPLSAFEEEQIARSINRFTGVSTGRAGDIETLVEFAPNFLRSGIETVISATLNGGLEGQVARKYISNMVIGAEIMAVGMAMAQGRPIEEVANPFDKKAMERGEFKLNPNFGTVRVYGQDISLFGRWDSLARMAAISNNGIANLVSGNGYEQLLKGVGEQMTNKGSPLIGLAQAIRTGNTYQGNDPFSPLGVAEQILPFTYSGYVSDVDKNMRTGDSPVAAGLNALSGAGLNFFGAKSRELTPFEQMNNAALGEYGKSLDEITGVQRQALDKKFPNIALAYQDQDRRLAKGGNKESKARIEKKAVDVERLDNESKAWADFQAGSSTPKQMADSLDEYQRQAVYQKQQIDTSNDIQYRATTGERNALSAYYATFDKASKVPGRVDYDLRDQLEAELMADIEAGKYGDKVKAKAFIEERKVAEHAPGADSYFKAKKYIRDAGYYDARDTAFDRFAGLASSASGGQSIDSYGDLVQQITLITNAKGSAGAARLNAIKSRIDAVSDPIRDRMRLRDPMLDESLLLTGGVSTPIRLKKR